MMTTSPEAPTAATFALASRNKTLYHDTTKPS